MPRKTTQKTDILNDTSNDGSTIMTDYAVEDPTPGSDTQGQTVEVPEQDASAPENPAEVKGPEVVSADSVTSDDSDAPAAATFDGTTSEEDRAQTEAEQAEAAKKAADESAAVAAAQRAEDLRFAAENPNSPIVRPANPAVGGESFI